MGRKGSGKRVPGPGNSLCKGPVVGGLGLLQELKKAENHLDLATESRGLCINHNLDIINPLL